MATVVKQTINGHEYLYRVEYLGNGNQKWDFLGKPGAVGVETGPIPDSTSKKDLLTNETSEGDVDRSENRTDTSTETSDDEGREESEGSGMEEIGSTEFRDMLDEGFKLSEAPDGVGLNLWTKGHRERLYINEWGGGDDAPWIDLKTGSVNDIDATVTRDDKGTVTITPEDDAPPITLQTNAGFKWEDVQAENIKSGDRVRYVLDENGRVKRDMLSYPEDRRETGEFRVPFDVKKIEREEVAGGIVPAHLTVTTADYGEFTVEEDSTIFERAEQDS